MVALWETQEGAILVKLALYSMCALGVFATYSLLTIFESVFKPLVYATLAFGIVQYAANVVQEGLESIFARCTKVITGRRLSQTHMDLEENFLFKVRVFSTEFRIPRIVSKCVASFLLFGLLLSFSAIVWKMVVSNLQATHFHTYQLGSEEVWNFTRPYARQFAPELFNASSSDKLVEKGIQIASDYASTIESGGLGLASTVSGASSQFVFFLIYFILWTSAPISEKNDIVQVVGTYAVLKTFCNLVYAALVGSVLYFMNVELVVVISVLSFFLAYIPEVGAIIALVLPLPLIIFDHNEVNLLNRFGKCGTVLIAMLLIKVVVSNGLEAFVMGSNKVLAGALGRDGKFEETHPVIVLVAVMVGAEVWDVTGMIISVPVVALLRTYYTRAMDAVESSCSQSVHPE